MIETFEHVAQYSTYYTNWLTYKFTDRIRLVPHSSVSSLALWTHVFIILKTIGSICKVARFYKEFYNKIYNKGMTKDIVSCKFTPFWPVDSFLALVYFNIKI